MLASDIERRKQAERILVAGRADENLLVEQQPAAQRSRILKQLDADHQPPAAYFLDAGQLP